MRLMIARLRSLLFWVHLAIGVSASALILVMCVTGFLLGFERQSIAAIDGTVTVSRISGATRLPLDSLLARHALARDDVATVVLRREPERPVTIRFRDRDRAAMQFDPWSGASLPSPPAGKGQAFFSALRRWHRWVGATGERWRARFRAATGAANLAFLFLIVSGLFLWWPRRWTRARLAATALPQLSAKGKARDFNWHHSFGLLAALPLALVVGSGVFISYQWPGRLLDRWLGSAAEQVAARQPVAAPRGRDAAPAANAASPEARVRADAGRTDAGRADAGLAAAIADAERRHPDWTQLTVTLPAPRDSVLRIAVAAGNTYRPDLRHTLTFDRGSAAFLGSTGYAQLSVSRRIRAWVRFGHTGEVFGIGGQLIATLVTAIGAVLVWTGLALTWRRFRQWRSRTTALSSP